MQREEGDPVRQEGKRLGSWHQTVEEVRHSQDDRRHGEWVGTTPRHLYAQSTYHCAYRVQKSVVSLKIVIVSRVLICLSVSGE